MANTTAADLNQKYSEEDEPGKAEKRTKWLQELEEWTPETFDESPHTTMPTGFLDHIIKTCPNEKLVVISQYLRYLDIIAILMEKRYNVKCLRYDGSVPQTQRVEVEKEFAQASLPRPLLMTAGAGSVGLNLTSGKIVVLVEEWWNYLVETQTISRCWRQGAVGVVHVVKFNVEDSAINADISRASRSIVRINESLIAPLFKNTASPSIVYLVQDIQCIQSRDSN